MGAESEITNRQHLEQVERQTGNRPASLDGPELPEAIEHLWAWYTELHSARGSGGFGPEPIRYTEIAAWAFLTARHPTPWEVEMIRVIDQAHLEHMAEKSRKPPDKTAG